ncbi:hypothetical protein RFI_38425, partial [Reticulomyxa filosa]
WKKIGMKLKNWMKQKARKKKECEDGTHQVFHIFNYVCSQSWNRRYPVYLNCMYHIFFFKESEQRFILKKKIAIRNRLTVEKCTYKYMQINQEFANSILFFF